MSNSLPQRIERTEWQERFHLPTVDAYTKADVRPGTVDVEFGEAQSHVSLTFNDEATDIRIGDLQFVVGRNRLSVLRAHPPFPIQQWTVLYDGPLPKREEFA